MAPRRASTRRETSTPSNRRGARGGIRKNTQNRQPLNRYGQPADPAHRTANSEETTVASSTSNEIEPSTPQYSHSPPVSGNGQHSISRTLSLASSPVNLRTRTTSTEPIPDTPLDYQADIPINLTTMRELLRSHEQDIIDRVLQQLSTQTHHRTIPASSNPLSTHPAIANQQLPQPNPTQAKIQELESQLADVREQRAAEQARNENPEPGLPSMYNPTQFHMPPAGESASTTADSVEMLFPGVERSSLIQIIENRCKPTNIYRLLASEKERAESQRTISIGGVEFEQAERDGKESEYKMSNFFKAWAAYCGIIVKLAPHMLQGDLATALSIYTMNLYDLLEKYAWEGVKAYHLQFHRKRVASGRSLYHPAEWRQLDSELVASKCFAYPVPRVQWPQSQRGLPPLTRRIHELPTRENLPGTSYSAAATGTASSHSTLDHRPGYNYQAQTTSSIHPAIMGTSAATVQACGNWNFRECRSVNCRNQHPCAICGRNHRASQCMAGSGVQGQSSRNHLHGR